MPNRHFAPLALSALLIAFVAVTGWSLTTFRRYQPYSGFFGVNIHPDRQYLVKLTDVDVRGRSGGRPSWSVHSNTMTLSLDRAHLIADGVTNGVMLEKSKPKLKFIADRAIYSSGILTPGNGVIEVAGRIHITSTSPVTPVDANVDIAANHAVWTEPSSTLDCSDHFQARFIRPDWQKPVDVAADALNWNGKSHVLHFTRGATMQCAAPESKSPDRMSVTSGDVVWLSDKSLVQCNAPAHVVCPLDGSSKPIVIDAQTATYDQHSGVVDCPTQSTANLELTDTHTEIHVTSSHAVWTPKDHLLTMPIGARADISSFGIVDCQNGAIDTRTHGMTFSQCRLIADNKDIVPAPENAPPAAPKAAEPADPNKVYVDAPEGGHWDEEHATMVLRGPVTFTQGDATMRTVGALYNRKTSTAEALAPVTITDPENTLTGEHATINFKTKVTVITGSVHIKQVPKDQPPAQENTDKESIEDVTKRPSDLTCDKIVYNYHDKTGDATGHVVISQKHHTVTADTGTYDANTKIATLVGNVVGKTDDGRILKAPKATVSMKKGDQWIEFPAQVNFEFTPSDEDNPRGPQAKPKSKPEKPAPTPSAPSAPPAPPTSGTPAQEPVKDL